jgi:hypothetical protein
MNFFRFNVLILILFVPSIAPAMAAQANRADLIEFVNETLTEIDDGNFHLVELKLLSDAKKTVVVQGVKSVANSSKDIVKSWRTSLPENQKTFHQVSNFVVRDYKDPNMGTSVQFNSTVTRFNPKSQSIAEAKSGVYVWSIVREKGVWKISSIYFNQKFIRT